jgi:hypothetical protein
LNVQTLDGAAEGKEKTKEAWGRGKSTFDVQQAR